MCYGQQPRDARAGELPRRLAVVKLDVLLFAGCVDSPHGPNALSSTFEKSLREIADFKEPKSAPACGESLEFFSMVYSPHAELRHADSAEIGSREWSW